VTMHHIASDGWSMAVLVNEFSEFYRAGVTGVVAKLPALAVQYRDYARWQRDWLQGEVLEAQLGYWQKQLADLPVVHSVPLDFARPKTQSFAGATVQRELDAQVSQQLKQLCQAKGATLFMGLHAALSTLLARYSNEHDIVVGSPIANREQSEVAGLIGFFVNTLVLRSDVSGNPGFGELIAQSKQQLLDAYAHQQVPFEKLVEVLQPERSRSHHALFQIMLVLQNNEEGVLELPGVQLSALAPEDPVAKYDLTVAVSETAAGLQVDFNYNTDLFLHQTIERMAVHFEALLKGLLATPEVGVLEVNFLSSACLLYTSPSPRDH
jgi:hypothetical protein